MYHLSLCDVVNHHFAIRYLYIHELTELQQVTLFLAEETSGRSRRKEPKTAREALLASVSDVQSLVKKELSASIKLDFHLIDASGPPSLYAAYGEQLVILRATFCALALVLTDFSRGA